MRLLLCSLQSSLAYVLRLSHFPGAVLFPLCFALPVPPADLQLPDAERKVLDSGWMHRWYLLKCRWRIRYLWEACVLDWKQAKTKSFGKNRLLVEGGQEGAEANGGWLILPYFPSGAQISCYSSRYKWKTCLPTPTPTPGEREVIYLKGRMRRVGMQGDNVLQNRVEIHRVFNYQSLCQMVKWAWSGNECVISVELGVVGRVDWMNH